MCACEKPIIWSGSRASQPSAWIAASFPSAIVSPLAGSVYPCIRNDHGDVEYGKAC